MGEISDLIQKILALDLGTSSVRAMLFDTRGREIADAQIAYEQTKTSDGGVETDAETLVTRTVRAVEALLKKIGKEGRENIVGIGVSCFWHSLVGVGKNGQAVTPLYSWADTRAARQAANLRQKWDAENYHKRTGCELHPSFWPAKLLWLQELDKENFDAVQTFMGFGEYLFLRLFGETKCSLSMASGTGLFDPNAKNWDAETLQNLPIDSQKLNALAEESVPQTHLTAEWAKRLPSLKTIPWFPAFGDGACSNLGGGGTTSGRIVINIGTSGAMRVTVESENVTISPGLFCYRVDSKRFLVGGAFANGGNVYAWAHETLTLPAPQISQRRLAALAPDSHGLTVLPFWAGERSPGWNSDARAAIVGMNLHTTPLDILRASLESVAYRFAAVRDLLDVAFPDAVEILASGGALAHSPAWAQILADVFGVSVTLCKISEASARGAALLASHSLGLLTDLDSVTVTRARTFSPDFERHAIYEKARKRQDALYEKLLTP